MFVSPSDIAVDADSNVYLAATAFSAGLPVTLGAFQADKKPGDRPDLYVAKLDPTASSLLAATYLGGADYDIAGGLALNPARPGVVYLSGTDRIVRFPRAVAAAQSRVRPRATPPGTGSWRHVGSHENGAASASPIWAEAVATC